MAGPGAHRHECPEPEQVGSEGSCSICGLPVIYTGKKWRWLMDMSPTERRKLQMRRKP